jgi:obg-like ATPase 1
LKNFPYATIDPEEARVIVPDERYDWLCEKYNPKSRVPANLTVYDIAGLTRGASTGAGLGNAFLSHIRAVDAIFQVVRCFDDAEIIHVEGNVDPTRDLDIIAEELRLKDIEFVEKALENQKKKTRMGGQSLELKKAKEEEATIEKILLWLKGGGKDEKGNELPPQDVRKGNWSPKEVSRGSFTITFTTSRQQMLRIFYDDKGPYGLTQTQLFECLSNNAEDIMRQKTHSDSMTPSHHISVHVSSVLPS